MEFGIPVPMTIKHLPALVLLTALGLSACDTGGDTYRLGQLALRSVTGQAGAKVPREAAAAIPYATAGLVIGGNDEALLVLGAYTPEQSEWYGGETVMVRTRKGRIVRTAGLPFDLGGLDVVGSAAPPVLSYDFPDLGIYSAAGKCTARDAGSETIEILGAALTTHHTVEHCEVAALRWVFDNEFWTDPATAYVWRSKQYIHPKSPVVMLEVLRPETDTN